jgi:hypothetical protein
MKTILELHTMRIWEYENLLSAVNNVLQQDSTHFQKTNQLIDIFGTLSENIQWLDDNGYLTNINDHYILRLLHMLTDMRVISDKPIRDIMTSFAMPIHIATVQILDHEIQYFMSVVLDLLCLLRS